MRVCSRKRYVFTSTAILQRVHLPTPERCVERCVENMSFCKAAVYTPYRDTTIGVCTLFSENSVQQPTALHPDASVEPVSTVHELLESCPQFSLPEIMNRISSNHRRKLESSLGRLAVDSEIRSDSFFPDQLDDSDRQTSDRYATMTPLFQEESPRHHHDSKEYHRPKSPFEGIQAIVPVAVLHMGKAVKPAYDSCGPGAMCVPTLMSLDSSPCPARQGDPCAPRPPCYPTKCPSADQHIAQPMWTEWSSCSLTCGPGMRTRQCSGVGCIGPALETCSLTPHCQEWAPWSSWTACSVSCGEGERKRTRECIGGRDCPGVSVTVETCVTPSCPSWSDWGPWEGCSITCGQGSERRSRKCQNGFLCPGQGEESRVCDRGICPQWAPWTSWTACSRSCDTGETYRTRECEHGSCEGASEERLLCNQQDCPTWTEWTAWTVCSNKCDEDTYRIRNRLCIYGGVTHNGCEGPAQDQSSCPSRPCPSWSDWSEWSECSATCGQGNQARTRTCENGSDCVGSNREIRFCQLASCPYWDEWMDWGGCSVTCGIGVCERRRRCITDDLLNLPNLEELDEALFEMDADRAKSILIARSRSQGQNPASGNHSSEEALERSRRTPLVPARTTIEGGGTCIGSDVDRKPCDAGPCCSWESWGEWSPCIGCGSQAVSRRSRICQVDESHGVFSPLSSQVNYRGTQPVGGGAPIPRLVDSYRIDSRASGPLNAPQGMSPIIPVNARIRRHATLLPQRGAQCCEGEAIETRQCDVACDRPCEWTEWGEWCGCAPCRGGREVRRRFCERDGPPGRKTLSQNGCNCPGPDTDERDCNIDKNCDSYRIPEDPGSPQNHGQQLTVDHRGPPGVFVPIRMRPADEFQKRGLDSQPLERKDSALSTTDLPLPSCRWSKWSEWSQCRHDNKLRQRNRFCIGNDVLVSDCECMGYSVEEEPCDVSLLTARVAGSDPDIHTTGRSSYGDLSNEDEKKLEENIQAALKPEASLQSGQDSVALSTSVTKTEKCEWTRWSQWSLCTVTCGTGERLRKRRCSCGDLRCGAGTSQETSKCSEMKCDRKMLPMFNID
ncbi:hypothetical protein V3C99_019022 [Haemonchus contortus]|uniref:Apple domain-containing protein n=1 Tax=Haemonchus contortus TaxID=6289 RepID=A0A7I4Z390_HAECO